MSLHDALIERDFKKARRLICRRAGINTPDESGETPLMTCVLRPGMEYLVQLLLAVGADLEAFNSTGETAFMLAAHISGNQENIRILLHAGADTGHISRYGYCAADYALAIVEYDWLFPENTARRNLLAILETARLVDVEATCQHSVDAKLFELALLEAVFSEDLPRAELLLKLGAPANSRTFYGWSVLMQAACRTNLGLVELLLHYGADPAYQNLDGRSALSEIRICMPGLRMTELIYCNETDEYALEQLGQERLNEIRAVQREIVQLLLAVLKQLEKGEPSDRPCIK